MTARQTGQKISELSHVRQKRRPSVQVRSGQQAKMSGREKRRLLQLVVCGCFFVFLVAVKLLFPSRMSQLSVSLSGIMNRNMDVSEVFSSIGRAVAGDEKVQDTLDDVYQAVFHPGEAEAVETASPAEPEYETPDPIQPLRAFADGTGTCSGWMMQQSTKESENTSQGEEEKAESAAEAAHRESTSGSSSEKTAEDTAQTMKLSSILYSGESVPANVNLEQAVLGFDYCTPVMGTLSSGFGYREHPIEGEEKFHYGIDIAANTGTEIECFADGTVTAVGESSSYGKYVIVAHKNSYSTLYAHCSAVSVHSGETVKEGEKIAEVGETGLATGPHLHFELHCSNQYLNPIYYVSTQ